MMENRTESIAQNIAGAVTKNRKRLMGFGILSLIFGIIGTFMSTAVTLTSVLILGFFVIFGGVVFLVEAFSAPDWKGKLLNLLIALLYIVAGAVMVANPLGSAVWFTLFIAAFLIVVGIMRMVMGFQIKDEINEWGWMVFGGVINIVLGILIYEQWPFSGLWIIGLFISVELIIQGVNAIVLARTIKKTQSDIKKEFS